MRWHLATVVLAVGGLVAGRAGAVEREHHVGGGAGGGVLLFSGSAAPTVTVPLEYRYGLTDAWNFVASAGVTLPILAASAARPATYPAVVAHGLAGVQLAFDRIAWVPYVGLSAGPAMLTGGSLANPRFALFVQADLGVDYRFSHNAYALGLSLRPGTFATAIGDYPFAFAAVLRFEKAWGW